MNIVLMLLVPHAGAQSSLDVSRPQLAEQVGALSFIDQDTLLLEHGKWKAQGDVVSIEGRDGKEYLSLPLIGRGADGNIYSLAAQVSEDKHTLHLGAVGVASPQDQDQYTKNLAMNSAQLKYNPMPLIGAYKNFVHTALENEPHVFLQNFVLGAVTGFGISILLGLGALAFLTAINLIVIAFTAVFLPLLFIPYLLLSAVMLIPVAMGIPGLIASSTAGGIAAGVLYSLYQAQNSDDPEVRQAAEEVFNIAEQDWQDFKDSLPTLKS